MFAANPGTPAAEDMQASAAARDGAFAAADEVCVGEGDISDSLARATRAGWSQFEPPQGSMMSRMKAAYLDGGDVPRPEVIFLRKNENRAEIVLFQLTTLLRSAYMHQCDVIERTAANLDEAALRSWAGDPIETRQVDNSPVYFDLRGSRFANNVGGNATAYYVPPGSGSQDFGEGLIVSFSRGSPENQNAQSR